MRNLDPRILLGVGFVLLLTGFFLPLLMVMQAIPSTFFLNFFAYGASTLGTMLGFIGAISIVARRRRK
jgi:hypothetical protein